MRHPAQGPGQRGDRLRAVGGLPVQSRHAVPEGREALPAGLASGSTAVGAAPRYVGALGFSACPTPMRSPRSPREISRLQQTHGPGSVAVLGGASLTTEKTYLLGKFARVCLKTPFIDYNGRLCMVSAGAANKKAFGIDRTTNPWSDMVGTEVIWVAGSNVAECSPITTNYIWQARELGARVIVQDPRITPVARTCDLYLPVKPGRDAALFAGVLQIMIERDWIDRAFIDEHTVGFEQVAEYCRAMDARADRRRHRRARSARSSRPPRCGAPPGRASSSTRAASSITRTACRTPSARSTSCSRPDGSAGRRAATAPSSARPTARAVASTARSAISCQAGATSATRSIGKYIAGVWEHRREGDSRARASTPTSCSGRSTRAKSKACLSICFNPKVSLPDNAFVTRCLEKLEFFVAIDFFLNDTARHADVVLPGSLHEEDEGTVTQVEGRIIKVNKAVECPGEAREDWRIIQDIAAALGRPHGFTFASPREIFEELRSRAKAASPTTPASPTRRSSVRWACSGRATARIRRPARRPPITRDATAVRAGQLQPGGQGAGSVLLSGRARRASMSPTTGRPSTMRARSIRSS